MKRFKADWNTIVFWLVFATLALSAVYTAVQIAQSAPDVPAGGGKSRGDYTIMLLKCILGMGILFLPTIMTRRFNVEIPRAMAIAYAVFLYSAIYLGEVQVFYDRIPHWDTILHAFSGGMLGAFGFIVVAVLNRQSSVKIKLSPLFESVFAFCFALSIGVLWEVYEFTIDGALGLNMQRFRLATGEQLIGRAALIDTMKDLITDGIAAFVVTFSRFAMPRGRKKAV